MHQRHQANDDRRRCHAAQIIDGSRCSEYADCPGESGAGAREKDTIACVNKALGRCRIKAPCRTPHAPPTYRLVILQLLQLFGQIDILQFAVSKAQVAAVAFQELGIRGSYTSASSSFANTSELLVATVTWPNLILAVGRSPSPAVFRKVFALQNLNRWSTAAWPLLASQALQCTEQPERFWLCVCAEFKQENWKTKSAKFAGQAKDATVSGAVGAKNMTLKTSK